MAEKNIELLDTPGRGGQYWKDEHALQSWMKKRVHAFDESPPKADAINKRVADSINPFCEIFDKTDYSGCEAFLGSLGSIRVL
ncbi:MAG: hypothetical protein MZV65_46395 [Chromatiales bacterium]|nr:hypothetical protein [Chromatiales bacterium]MCK7582303.1 hypothetical protein [Chromatiales bacterium]